MKGWVLSAIIDYWILYITSQVKENVWIDLKKIEGRRCRSVEEWGPSQQLQLGLYQ